MKPWMPGLISVVGIFALTGCYSDYAVEQKLAEKMMEECEKWAAGSRTYTPREGPYGIDNQRTTAADQFTIRVDIKHCIKNYKEKVIQGVQKTPEYLRLSCHYGQKYRIDYDRLMDTYKGAALMEAVRKAEDAASCVPRGIKEQRVIKTWSYEL